MIKKADSHIDQVCVGCHVSRQHDGDDSAAEEAVVTVGEVSQEVVVRLQEDLEGRGSVHVLIHTGVIVFYCQVCC